MRIAVIQHHLRGNATADAEALVSAARSAIVQGAQVLVFPEVATLADQTARENFLGMLEPLKDSASWLLPSVSPDSAGQAFSARELPGLEHLGRVAFCVGDAAIDPAQIGKLAFERPDVLLLTPRSESDIQAEAVLELALGLSGSVAGLVIVAEPTGAKPGSPGHGGSAIMLFGEVVSEALEDEDVLVADVPAPVPQPEPREPIPQVPPILLQRLAHHRGERPPIDYLAELS